MNYKGITLWDSLLNSVVTADSINSFKSPLDKFWSLHNFVYDYTAQPLISKFPYDRSYYFHQVNGVNGRDTVFIRCVSVCAQQNGQSYQFKTVKAMDFKFDVHVSRHSLDMTP